MTASSEDWQAKVERKQAAIQRLIPSAWRVPDSVTSQLKYPLEGHSNRLIEWDIVRKTRILTDKELSITEDYSVAQLLENLAAGNLTAVEVTTAFSKRASIAGQLTNCLTETYFHQALERAKHLDEMRLGGKLAGPLHGLPISLKDSFQLVGSESTIGYVSYLGQHAETDSPLLEILIAKVPLRTSRPIFR
jgi:amidase